MNPVESRDKPQPEDNEYSMAQRCVRLHCSAAIHSVCVQSAFAPEYTGAIPVLDIVCYGRHCGIIYKINNTVGVGKPQ